MPASVPTRAWQDFLEAYALRAGMAVAEAEWVMNASNHSASVGEPMKTITYRWRSGGSEHALNLVYVEGTAGRPFLFGEGHQQRAIEVPGFYIPVPVTQAVWKHVPGFENNPSHRPRLLVQKLFEMKSAAAVLPWK